MRIRTQNLPYSFSSDNKKQKVVCPKLRIGQTSLVEINLSESIDQLAVSVNYERFTLLTGMSDKRGIMGAHT